MDPYIGEIVMFAGNFAPRSWALCQGQLLAISTNTALFSILGTTYGGDGRTTFGLPDLRGRVAVHPGSGPGLEPIQLGQKGGVENVTLTGQTTPQHTHAVACATQKGTTASADPQNNNPSLATDTIYNSKAGASTVMAGAMIRDTGGGQAHANVQPFLTVNYIIALQGVFPSRN